MKKISLILILFAALILDGCNSATETNTAGIELKTEGIQAGEGLPVEYRSLSDIQIAACNAANEAGTCDTRLAELGIVLKEECCEVLGNCC